MLDLTPVLVLAVIFGSIVMLVYLNIRKKERMLLIEKGADASIFATKADSAPSLKWGILLTGLAVGLLIGYLLETYINMRPEVAYFSMLFLFGGLGLITYYLIERKSA
jgi:F0F1-type ATP synthase assembly protein I